MSRKYWFIIIIPLILTWSIDQVTKQIFFDLSELKSFGIIHFFLHHNHGAMLGLFSDLPAILRIVSLSTGGAFLIFIYGIIQYLLPIKSTTLRIGMSILLGGILGNVTDRIIWGYVIDFIIIGNSSFSSPAFNMADFLQWIGYGFIIYALIKEKEILWPENNLRKSYWINPSFQIKYCLILVGVGIGLTLIIGIYSYTYLRVTITELIGQNPIIHDKFLIPFIITLIIISLAFQFILFLIGKIISHRTAGPIFAFEKFLENFLKGDLIPLKLRKNDDFKYLEDLSHMIIDKLGLNNNHHKVQFKSPNEKELKHIVSNQNCNCNCEKTNNKSDNTLNNNNSKEENLSVQEDQDNQDKKIKKS